MTKTALEMAHEYEAEALKALREEEPVKDTPADRLWRTSRMYQVEHAFELGATNLAELVQLLATHHDFGDIVTGWSRCRSYEVDGAFVPSGELVDMYRLYITADARLAEREERALAARRERAAKD